MWKVCRKTIFPRWHTRKQNASKRKDVKIGLVQSAGSHNTTDDGSGSDEHEKQRAHKHRAFWEDPQYFSAIQSSWWETVGLIGTAVAVGLNSQHRNLKHLHCNDGLYVCDGQRACQKICTDIASLFKKYVWAMPKASYSCALPEKAEILDSPTNNQTDSSQAWDSANKKGESLDGTLKEMRQITNEYIAESKHRLGLKLLNTNTLEAFKLFKSSAQLGHTKAIFNLGLCYETGKGTKIDLRKAADCYLQAALKGHQYALYNLGVYHIKGLGGMRKNEKVGLQLLKKAAGQGVVEAQVYMGLQYLEEGKWWDACNMFNASVKQNNADGKYYLGMCYENGWGVVQSEKNAVEMYISAALNGHDDAIFNLGQYYESGRGGLGKNVQFAMALYQIIADKGHVDATNSLSVLKNKSHFVLKPSSIIGSLFADKPVLSAKGGLHESASLPELRNYSQFLLPETHKLQPSPHLDLVVPFASPTEMCGYRNPVQCNNYSQSIFPSLTLMTWNGVQPVLAGT